MNPIVEEIRRAYATVGITLDAPATYGTYYRLPCAGCGRMVGNTGDRLLPGMAAALVAGQSDLYASGLLGCPCGHQSGQTRAPGETRASEDAERRGRTDLWPFWKKAYAEGDPLPKLTCQVERPTYAFGEGDPPPKEYRDPRGLRPAPGPARHTRLPFGNNAG